ncbi:hypothetical protein GCM10023089_15860 [Quisquiliibacterium transsilvanicum]
MVTATARPMPVPAPVTIATFPPEFVIAPLQAQLVSLSLHRIASIQPDAKESSMAPRHPIAPVVPAGRPRPRSRPMVPSRRRLDPDRIVGFACAALLPLALWLART